MMEYTKLKELVSKVIKEGPNRVVIDSSGEATTPERAVRDHGVTAALIFIRNDGWSVGCPVSFGTVTRSLWEDAWIAVAWHDNLSGWKWKTLPLEKEEEALEGLLDPL